MSSTADRLPTPWVEVPPASLRGEELRPYYEGEIANLFDWAENPNGRSRHLMPHRGQFIVDIVEIEANAVHQPSKPGDELVVIVNGILTLTNDDDATEQSFRPGEMVLIPAGWAGSYRVIEDNGAFIEIAIVPGDYFDSASAPPPSGKVPHRLEFPKGPGKHTLHKNRYLLEAENTGQAAAWPIAAASDEIIQILGGTLTLSAAGNKKSFGEGSIVILPIGFKGEAEATAEYRALHARWIG